MKILYLTNIHNPYRDEFFEQLGRQCDLTVLFERRADGERDASWFSGPHGRAYREVFLSSGGRRGYAELRGLVDEGWDLVVVGCYNSKLQMLTIEHLRRHRIRYAVNLDGPLFNSGSALKRAVRKHVLKGAQLYLVAGRTSVGSVRREVGEGSPIVPYSFSSLTEAQIDARASLRDERDKSLILCVGQFLPYKGIDVLLDAFAELNRDGLRLRIIGAGKRDHELKDAVRSRGLEASVETVPFLAPEELAHEYARAGLFVLPSRQECWGLVVNEAAACGCLVVGTWGAGAAVEFLSGNHADMLAEPGDSASLCRCMQGALRLREPDLHEYSRELRSASSRYSVEATVSEHLTIFASLLESAL